MNNEQKGGCGCPFPCKSIDKDWKKLNASCRKKLLERPNAQETPDGHIVVGYENEIGTDYKIEKDV